VLNMATSDERGRETSGERERRRAGGIGRTGGKSLSPSLCSLWFSFYAVSGMTRPNRSSHTELSHDSADSPESYLSHLKSCNFRHI